MRQLKQMKATSALSSSTSLLSKLFIDNSVYCMLYNVQEAKVYWLFPKFLKIRLSGGSWNLFQVVIRSHLRKFKLDGIVTKLIKKTLQANHYFGFII